MFFLVAMSWSDFSTAFGDLWAWYIWGIDNCGRGPERWGEDCTNSFRNR